VTWVPLSVEDCDPDPFVQFRRWFDEAEPLVAEREAVALVTSTPDGRPSARMVLLRHVGADSFGWYTNYRSRKGRELAANPRAALLWYCEPLGRQIRVEGRVAPMTGPESDAYFAQRPRNSQVGAHASEQSSPLGSREELTQRVREFEALYEGAPVPRPDHWGGHRLLPDAFEFWQHREDRLHDRVLYSPDGGRWDRRRLAP
jgi:pyridoxamine 5'-phosphate oxidase